MCALFKKIHTAELLWWDECIPTLSVMFSSAVLTKMEF
jgi:hypothetical protein